MLRAEQRRNADSGQPNLGNKHGCYCLSTANPAQNGCIRDE